MTENYSYWLVQQYKAKLNLPSDRQAALKIDGMTDGSLGQIKKGDRHLTPEQGLFIAEQCGLDIGEVLVKLDIERSKSPAVQEALTQFLKRIATAVAVVSLSLSLMLSPQSHDAAASV